MAVYVGVMGKDTEIKNFRVVGSVEILCNPLLNQDKTVVGPVKYNIHPSHLDLVDCFSANEQYPGFSVPRNYRAVFREVASRQRTDESTIVLFRKESIPVGCFLCSDYPRDEMVYVARASVGLREVIEKVGRDFMKEL